MTRGSKALVAALLLIGVVLLLTGCGGGNSTSARGRYIYDESNRLPLETQVSLASYLWKLDSKTGYELVYVFLKDQLDETQLTARFNKLAVGKQGKDTGAAVFVEPDNSVFVAIGSGNDKVSVTYSKTVGEKIFTNLASDPALTTLRFASEVSGKVDEASSQSTPTAFFDTVKSNFGVIFLWTCAIALLAFALAQLDGFQPEDLIWPARVFVGLVLFFGISALGSASKADSYHTFGVTTSEKHSTYDWAETVCMSTGETTICYPVYHTDYRNDVTFLSYDSVTYNWRFVTTDSKGAWDHKPGELDELKVTLDAKKLLDTASVDDKSGGKSIGDGVWIYAGRKS